MAYTDVTAEAVHKAVADYDDRGAEDFLRAYGFEPARQYQLLVHGKRYPSKAIVGAAHQYVHGRPLRADEFSGGAATVVRHLTSLGFEIEATRPVLMIHVGQASLDNLEHGLETSTWGFRELPADLAGARFDFVVFGEGASPRVPDEAWFADTATLHICQATSGFYTTDAKHWPDELDRDELIYPVHFGILPLATADAVPLGPDGPLSADASRQLKISGTHRGFGKIAHFDPAPLLARAGLADAVDLPRNPQERAKITLSRAPGTRRTQRTNPSGRHGSGPGRQQDPKNASLSSNTPSDSPSPTTNDTAGMSRKSANPTTCDASAATRNSTSKSKAPPADAPSSSPTGPPPTNTSNPPNSDTNSRPVPHTYRHPLFDMPSAAARLPFDTGRPGVLALATQASGALTTVPAKIKSGD